MLRLTAPQALLPHLASREWAVTYLSYRLEVEDSSLGTLSSLKAKLYKH